MKVAFSILLFLMTSCNMMNDPTIRGVVSPDPSMAWTPCFPTYAKKNTLEDLSWFLDGKVLDVADLIDLALRNNPRTQRAWFDARIAARTWRLSENELFPEINFSETLDFNKLHFGPAGAPGSEIDINTGAVISVIPFYNQTLTPQLTVSYLMLDFGGRGGRIEDARQALLMANWTQHRILQTVIFNVLQAYYSVQNAQAQLEARYQDLQDAETTLAATESSHQAGVSTKVDVLQALSNRSNAQLQVESAIGQLGITRGDLANALGLPANESIEVSNLPEDLPLDKTLEGVDQLVDTAKARRPDLNAAYSQFLQSEAQYIVAKSAGLPILFATADLQQYNYIDVPHFNTRTYTGGITLQIPIFKGFYYENLKKRAQEKIRATYANVKDVESSIILDVVTSYNLFQTAVKQVKTSEDYLRYSDEAYRATLESYKMGTVTIVDLLNAQASLADARFKRIQSRTNWMVSLADVAYSTGVLDP